MKDKPLIAITMGDPAGIGPEVIVKSLATSEVNDACTPLIVGSAFIIQKAVDLIGSDIAVRRCENATDIDFHPHTISVLDSISGPVNAIEFGHDSKLTGQASAQAVQKGVKLALEEKVDAIVTGPTSKHALHLAGYIYPGQTEFLADLTRTPEVVMMMVSENLRVALVTTHCSLSDVTPQITKETVLTKLTILNTWLQDYFGLKKPRIAVCGLNPHAGDGGIFGREEIEIIEPAIQRAKSLGLTAAGPVPADTLFAQLKKEPYDAYLAMYHDQGLVPVKMDAFGKGVNVTLGLPIIRTSPDHGTAFDIAGKGIADQGSMIEAIKLAVQMARENR
ncbi:MAG: 4-hydroxythreonine-4-phosphate dehydrogenase PdxA [Gemmatimonadota bacterium]|nr:MAG: 4-hydroxythreonine-4-phosphate dehydrogenase PdxA [Gemmatimonadota bacterium]